MLFQPWARRLLARTLLIPVISHNDQKRPHIPPLQGEGDHEVVEGCLPIERLIPLRLAYGHPPPLAGEDDRERPFAEVRARFGRFQLWTFVPFASIVLATIMLGRMEGLAL